MRERAQTRIRDDRLTAIIKELQRHRFGRRSERLDPGQLALALEDVEQMLAAADAAAEKDGKAPAKPAAARQRQDQSRRVAAASAARGGRASMSRTRPARAAAASSTASARTSRSGST